MKHQGFGLKRVESSGLCGCRSESGWSGPCLKVTFFLKKTFFILKVTLAPVESRGESTEESHVNITKWMKTPFHSGFLDVL